DHSRFAVSPARDLQVPSEYAIEPDITAASYFMVLPLIHGGQLRFPQLKDPRVKQGDIAFASVLQQLGMQVEWNPQRGLSFTVPADQAWKRGHLSSAAPRTYDFNAFSDTFMTLSALAPLFPGPITIHGIAHTRKQE